VAVPLGQPVGLHHVLVHGTDAGGERCARRQRRCGSALRAIAYDAASSCRRPRRRCRPSVWGMYSTWAALVRRWWLVPVLVIVTGGSGAVNLGEDGAFHRGTELLG